MKMRAAELMMAFAALALVNASAAVKSDAIPARDYHSHHGQPPRMVKGPSHQMMVALLIANQHLGIG
jgi:hypothetical protein